ncbi:MAG: arsenic resistance protein [Halomonas sp.]|nr:arsenic resistance protein [Halomonas sp.]MDM7483340.1 arsenic resistance protein [Halomonas sp.]
MKDILERQQCWLYLFGIGLGISAGLWAPERMAVLEPLLWPLLGALLYTTFTQIPLLAIRQGLQDKRFIAALLVGNFIVIPAAVGLAALWLPLPPALLAGVLLVLLVPCTDWFITFTHLGKGDTGRAIAATPLLLLIQMIALPVYLWWLLGIEWLNIALSTALISAFVGLIATPLLLAWLTERLAERSAKAQRITQAMGYCPVPLLAVVVFIIAASQVASVVALAHWLLPLGLLFSGYLLLAGLLGRALGRLFSLPTRSARTLAFSFGTRNSFVMLPIALTLPNGWQAAVVVIVFQSLVELFGMVGYLRWVPGKLLPEPLTKNASLK